MHTLQLKHKPRTGPPVLMPYQPCVVFGQATVRKLRKNPATKDALGIEFVSGWDIINVAQALALPKKYGQWLNKGFLGKGVLGLLHANAEVLYEHTNRFDRIMAGIFFVPWVIGGSFGIVLMLLDLFGAFQ